MPQRCLPVLLGAALALLSLAACRGAPPRVEYGSDVPTEDGLYLIRNATNHTVYVRPGARLRDYSELVVDPFSVSYAVAPGASQPGGAQVRTLDPDAEARLIGELRFSFIQEMKRSSYFRVVDAPGPAAVRVQGWLYDLAIEAPDREDPRNFQLCFGTMDLILNVRDSRSATALARVSDRIAVSCEREGDQLYYAATWRDMRGMLRPWASFLRASLDELHELPSLPAAPAAPPHTPP
jgi:Protein of unknown function (DUF3313)